MPNTNIQRKMNPHSQYGRDSVGKISQAVMSFNGKDILLVEGKTDEKLYKKFTGTKPIEVFPVYGKGQYLDERDSLMIGKINNVSPKLSIILLVKRCFAREWAKGVLYNKFYGIVDRDFFFDEELEFVNDSLLYNSAPMTEEDWKAFFCDIIANGRITTTDTNDVETLVFKFDFDAVKKTCGFITSKEFDELKNEAINEAYQKGFKRYETEKNYNDGGSKNKKIFFSLAPDSSKEEIKWKYCKGHDLVCKFMNAINSCANRSVFDNERYFMNAVMKQINVMNFDNTNVYQFIKNI